MGPWSTRVWERGGSPAQKNLDIHSHPLYTIPLTLWCEHGLWHPRCDLSALPVSMALTEQRALASPPSKLKSHPISHSPVKIIDADRRHVSHKPDLRGGYTVNHGQGNQDNDLKSQEIDQEVGQEAADARPQGQSRRP